MTDLDRNTSLVLHYMTLAGILVLVAGLLLHSTDHSDGILYVGTVILISAPMAGVAVSTVCLAKIRDTYWLKVALVLIAVVAAGLLITYFG